MLASLVAALASALCYGIAAVMQAIAVRAASHRTAAVAGEAGQGVDPGLLVRMLRQGLFLASIAIDLLGFIAQLIALRRLPIFAVQAIMAANLAVTAVFAAWLMKVRLQVREWLAVAGVVVGVALLGLSAGAQGAARVGSEFQLGLIVAVVGSRPGRVRSGAAAQSGPYSRPRRHRRPRLRGAGRLRRGSCRDSALLQLIKSPATYTLAAAGIVSFLLYATALEGGSVTTATAAVVLAETMPPAIIGVLFLGDTTRRGLAAIAGLGFALAVACARSPSPGSARRATAPAAAQPGGAGGAVRRASQPPGRIRPPGTARPSLTADLRPFRQNTR